MEQNTEGEAYSLTYNPLVFDDLAALDPFWQGQIRTAIEAKLLIRPALYGKPLRYSLRGRRSLRVGDYRVVFRIDRRIIRILAVVHRSSGYQDIEKRF